MAASTKCPAWFGMGRSSPQLLDISLDFCSLIYFCSFLSLCDILVVWWGRLLLFWGYSSLMRQFRWFATWQASLMLFDLYSLFFQFYNFCWLICFFILQEYWGDVHIQHTSCISSICQTPCNPWPWCSWCYYWKVSIQFLGAPLVLFSSNDNYIVLCLT